MAPQRALVDRAQTSDRALRPAVAHVGFQIDAPSAQRFEGAAEKLQFGVWIDAGRSNERAVRRGTDLDPRIVDRHLEK